ncbi:hypothetical protein WCD74_27075 [Actinomycetospora sp. OC33-EN08]|uniref:Ankyrin repeat domain-containing protein n=1 Tax=Actinomycetospora aurantiaca TaxID=3129233 RepID=A0ABU8MW27_9PSEU
MAPWFRRRSRPSEPEREPVPVYGENPFTEQERAELAGHGFVVFAERVIFEAQPPMPAARMRAIEVVCAGPLPPELRALWGTTAGGRLDYDLSVDVGDDHHALLSFAELFYPDSDGYRDLMGWISHELELGEDAARERGDPEPPDLDGVPIGGFEYTDRIYVRTAPGPDAGRVVAWMIGLPPGWTHALHQDSVMDVADDLPGAFRALRLDRDPLAPAIPGVRSSSTGETFLDAVEQHREQGLDPDLADRLVAFYRQAVVDWEGLLDAGRLAEDRTAARLALRRAVEADDVELLGRVLAAGVDPGLVLAGSARAVDLALSHHAPGVLAALLDAGAEVPPGALDAVNGPIGTELVVRMLEAGARPSTKAVLACVVHGVPASADAVRRALGDDEAVERHRAADLAELEETVVEVRAHRRGHYLGVDELQARADRLRAFASD